MVQRLLVYWRNAKEMPTVLSLLCRGGMVAGPVLLFFLLVPIQDWNVNGQPMSYGELWRSGAGVSAATFVGLVTAGTWGMAARRTWSRWALVAAPVLPIIFFPKALVPDLGFVIANGVVTAAVVYGCLFRLQSVREYLQSGHGDDPTA